MGVKQCHTPPIWEWFRLPIYGEIGDGLWHCFTNTGVIDEEPLQSSNLAIRHLQFFFVRHTQSILLQMGKWHEITMVDDHELTMISPGSAHHPRCARWGIRATDSLDKFVTAMQRALEAFPLGQRDEPRWISPWLWHHCAMKPKGSQFSWWTRPLDQLGRIIQRLKKVHQYFPTFLFQDAFSQQS